MPSFSQSYLVRVCYIIQALAAIHSPVAQAFLPTQLASAAPGPLSHSSLQDASSVPRSMHARTWPLKVSAIDASVSETTTSYLERQAQQLGEAAQQLLHSGEEYIDACNSLNEYGSCIADIYEDVGRIFQSVSAHGDGSLQLSTLEDHLTMRADSAAAVSLINSVVGILHDTIESTSNERTVLSRETSSQKVRHQDVENAFTRYIAAQQIEL